MGLLWTYDIIPNLGTICGFWVVTMPSVSILTISPTPFVSWSPKECIHLVKASNTTVGPTYRVGLRAQTNFSAPTFEPVHETGAGQRAALLFSLSQLQLRWSNSISCPQASSPQSEQRRTWLLFAEQIEIFQVKAWLSTFKARNANLKLWDDRRKRKRKEPNWPAEGIHVRLRRSIVDLPSLGRCRSPSKFVVFGFCKLAAS